MPIAIIGTGNVGSGLGLRLVECGHDIVFGVRADKNVSELLEQCGGLAKSASVAEAVSEATVVFLAVPGSAAVDALAGIDLAGKVVVDCNNPLTWDNGPVWAPPAEGSLTAQLAAAYPAARCVKAFNTFGSEFHRDPALAETSIDVHLAGDDADAKALVSEIAENAGFTPIDVGGLRQAGPLENLAVIWIQLALIQGHGRHIGFKLLANGPD